MRVKNMNFPIEANDEKIKKSIKKRDDESFVIAYELLKDQKFRKVKAKDTICDLSQDEVPSYILNQIANVLISDLSKEDNISPYGRKFTKPSKILAEIVLQALKKNKIEFSIKSTHPPRKTPTTA